MGMPAYRPKKDAASTAKPAATATQPQPPPTKNAHVGKEKHGGFFRRLFKRSKSRETLHAPKEAPLKENAPPPQPQPLPQPPPQPLLLQSDMATLPLSTFAAQFPPTEWLHDPATFRVPKTRRPKKERAMAGLGESVWIDLEPGAAPPPRQRRPANALPPLFAAPRFPSAHDHLDRKANRQSQRPPRRLNKYLSSSSEALHPISVPHESAQHRRHHRHRKAHHASAQPRTPVLDSPRAPLAAPTTTELDTTIDQPVSFQPNTSSPIKPQPDPVTEETKAGSSHPPTTSEVNRVSDSALSVSPVVTEMSSSSKFSSWSGSEGARHNAQLLAAHPDPSYVNLPHHTGFVHPLLDQKGRLFIGGLD